MAENTDIAINEQPPNQPAGRSPGRSWLTILGLTLTLLMVVGIASIPLSLNEQLLFALAALGLSMVIRPNTPDKRLRILALIMISTVATARYIYWRFTQSLGWFDPHLDLSMADYIFSFGLLAAEIYAWIILFLGYFQTLWPIDRPVEPLPDDQSLWPTVDVFIPTYNEPLKVVAPTVLAARDIDYPESKLNVYLLDDGNREEFRQFAKQARVHYLARSDNKDAKAGNLNRALAQTSGELVAIFDSDHVPVHAFLKSTVGWFLKDRKLGIMQTPHLFYTPDPIERNLNTFRRIPNENNLFYGLIQPGNDTWNAAFFCGSCAVLRRKAIEDAGGISTESVTEDVHTSLRIQQKGWNSAYIREPLAAGMATERLSDHIGQRTRWARGMVQMLRIDNPLFARGLTLGQRLTYLNSSLHFLFSLPRIVFLTSPLAFLFFNGYVLQASAGMIAVYALHHIFQAHIANSAMQSSCRHSFWAEVYETLLAGNILGPTLRTFLFPGSARFNVTRKGGKLDENRFDWRSSKFIVFLLLINLVGIGVGLWRLSITDSQSGDFGTLIITLLWTLYNCVILGAAVAVAFEHAQHRDAARLPRTFNVRIETSDGAIFNTMTTDISTQGLGIRIPEGLSLHKNQALTVTLQDPLAGITLQAPTVAKSVRRHLAGLEFSHLDIDQARRLVHFTHGRNDAWKAWYAGCEPKKPLASFLELASFALRGIGNMLFRKPEAAPGYASAPAAVRGWIVIFLAVATGFLISHSAQASVTDQPASQPRVAEPSSPPPEQRSIRHILSFKHLGAADDIHLRGAGTQNDIWFSIRDDEIVNKAIVHLKTSFTPTLAHYYRDLDIQLNGQSVGRINIDTSPGAPSSRWIVHLPRRLILDENQLSFRLEPREVGQCPRLDDTEMAARILSDSEIRIDATPLTLEKNLALLPAPFFDPRDQETLSLPFIIPDKLRQSAPALQAAGIVSSWFGAQAGYRHADFPVSPAPAGNHRYAIALVTPGQFADQLGVTPIDGPGVALVDHPDRPSGQILAITGRTPQELLAASKALVTTTFNGGARRRFSEKELQAGQKAKAGADWLATGKNTPLSQLAAPTDLVRHGANSTPMTVDFRLPPDLFDWRQQELLIPVITEYEYRGPAPQPGSHLDISVNSRWHERIPLDGDSKEQTRRTEGDATIIRGKHLSHYPAIDLPSRNRLSYYFDIRLNKQDDASCQPVTGANIITSIGPGSHIDLTGMRHFTRLPNLAKFANLGFPFSRAADLGTTLVHLPAAPNGADLRLYLNTLGHLGGATGSPASRVEVALANQTPSTPRPDHLFIGDFQRLPLLQRYADNLPIHASRNKDELGIVRLSWTQRALKWLKGESNRDAARINHAIRQNPESGAAIVGFTKRIRGVVRTGIALLAQTPSQSQALSQALISDPAIATIHGDLSLLDPDGNFRSALILPTTNYGHLPPVIALRMFFRNYPLALILWMVVTTFFGAWVLHHAMRRRANWRLHGRASPQGIIYTRR